MERKVKWYWQDDIRDKNKMSTLIICNHILILEIDNYIVKCRLFF